MSCFQGRILALDLGKRRIGLAMSDELGLTAQGLPTLIRTKRVEDFDAIQRLIAENGIRLVVVGKPLHMSGTEGRQANYALQFARTLANHSGVEIKLWDERLTTVEANRVLKQSGMSREKQRAAIDRLSAVLILQSYLDSLAAEGAGNAAGAAE